MHFGVKDSLTNRLVGFMGIGIVVCGLNGSGKSTLGKALAEKLNFHFIDNEDLFFPKVDKQYPYAAPRTREEAKGLLLWEIKTHENFVLASVTGNYGDELYPFFQYAVLIDVAKVVRMQRVKNRSFQKFGERMLPGGDLYEQEKKFFDFVSSRAENMVEEWVASLSCPVIRVDGTKLVEENLESILEQMRR